MILENSVHSDRRGIANGAASLEAHNNQWLTQGVEILDKPRTPIGKELPEILVSRLNEERMNVMSDAA